MTKARRQEITEKWLGTGENVVRDKSLRQALRNQADNHDDSDALMCDSDSEDEVDEEGEQEDDDQMDTDDEPPDSDGDALIGRVIEDTENGSLWVPFRVTYSREYESHLLYAYPNGESSPTLAKCESWALDDVLDGDWAVAEDGLPMRKSKWPETAAVADAKPQPSVEEMSVLDLDFNDLSPDEHGSGPFKIFKVEMCEYQRKWMAMAYYRKLDEAEPTGLLDEWPLQTPVMELLRSGIQPHSHTHSIAPPPLAKPIASPPPAPTGWTGLELAHLHWLSCNGPTAPMLRYSGSLPREVFQARRLKRHLRRARRTCLSFGSATSLSPSRPLRLPFTTR